MPQDRESGAIANEYGRATAKKIAAVIGATAISQNSNEFELDGKHITIRCARYSTTKFGVTYKMLKRVEIIFGAIEQKNGSYNIYIIEPNHYAKHMTDTRSKGKSAGKVGMVNKKVFIDEGKYFCNAKI